MSSSVNRHLAQQNSKCSRTTPINSGLVQVQLRRSQLLDSLDGRNTSGEADDGVQHLNGNGSQILEDFDMQDDSPISENAESEGDDVQVEPIKDIYPGAGEHFGRGETFLDRFRNDCHNDEREENLYYPFASRREWEIGSWLLRSRLSMAAIDEFLSLEIIQGSCLSFSNAKELRSRAELLPSGPEWICTPMTVQCPSKAPVHLYHRDAIQCLQSLMLNPLHADVLEFSPYKLYADVDRSVRLYTEWLSGDVAWQMQEKIPQGATLLGAVLSSDKTKISILTGNRTAYPLIISLANIKKAYRLKNSHNTFMLLALLPVAKFIHRDRRTRSLLHDQLTHACLDLVLRPLKVAALQGIMLSDPLGFQRLCYTSIASYTADTPEAQLLACVGAKSSPVTTANYKEFGDAYRHPTRTGAETLMQLRVVKSRLTPLSTFVDMYKEAGKFRLNGVLDPFWRDWFMADPSNFITPEPLHQWHKQFWDHDAKWCIAIVGPGLIDFLFSILQPRIGYRQFREGISSLKQVTGRDHREIQRYIIAIIAGIAPKEVVFAIRSLMDVRYLAQCPASNTGICEQIGEALAKFHQYKNSILDAGGRLGKGRTRINHWRITKLELYHNVVPSIIANGSAEQWNADITEHTHHTEIKVPARSGNNQNYDAQILRTLDRMDKCQRFDLATSIKDSGASLRPWIVHNNDDEDDYVEDDFIVDSATSLISRLTPVSTKIFGTQRSLVNYFAAAAELQQGRHCYRKPPPKPFRIFASSSAAFQLARDPQLKTISIDEATVNFNLPDFRHALNDFILHLHANGDTPCRIGGRRGNITSPLSFQRIQVWTKIRIQNRSVFYPFEVLPAETINCLPATTSWPHGLYDTVLVNTDGRYKWPKSQMNGHAIAQLRLIFRIVSPDGSTFMPGLNGFLSYVQRFDVISTSDTGGGSSPDRITGMYALRRSLRANGTRQGSIIQIKHIQKPLMLVPRFRRDVDPRLTKESCMEHFSEFWLNDYFDKETFYSFRLRW